LITKAFRAVASARTRSITSGERSQGAAVGTKTISRITGETFMTDKSNADPKARPTAIDRPAPASQKPDAHLSDAALDKVVGGAAFNNSKSGIQHVATN
jgi:hypothetical protein